jgi:hypothetical protein
LVQAKQVLAGSQIGRLVVVEGSRGKLAGAEVTEEELVWINQTVVCRISCKNALEVASDARK